MHNSKTIGCISRAVERNLEWCSISLIIHETKSWQAQHPLASPQNHSAVLTLHKSGAAVVFDVKNLNYFSHEQNQ